VIEHSCCTKDQLIIRSVLASWHVDGFHENVSFPTKLSII